MVSVVLAYSSKRKDCNRRKRTFATGLRNDGQVPLLAFHHALPTHEFMTPRANCRRFLSLVSGKHIGDVSGAVQHSNDLY